MKKKCFYIMLSVLLILLLLLFFKTDETVLRVDGIKYSVAVNDVEQNTFPSKGSYSVSISCTNSDSRWDYENWVAEVYNITGDVMCNIKFETISKTLFSDKIISLLDGGTSVLSESTLGNGSTLEKINSSLPTSGTSTDYRYRGVNPANYVMFNNELWRVIGVFDSNSHGIPSKNLVKLIRKDPIGSYNFDVISSSTGSNNFPDSDVYKILNNAYYNTTSSNAPPIDGTGQDYCYDGGLTSLGKCDFTGVGIQPEYKPMVEDGVTWYLGGNGSVTTSTNFYKYERTSTKIYTGNSPSTSAPIGLMYASDYGYAAPSACTNTSIGSFTSNNSTLGTTCGIKNWLESNYLEWMITHQTGNKTQNFYIAVGGNVAISLIYSTVAAIRPVLYLDSSVYYLSGTGTQADPYIIAMD